MLPDAALLLPGGIIRPPVFRLSRRQETLLVVLLLLLGALLRLSAPGLTHFQADEARLYMRAWTMAQEGSLATHGIASSIGFPNSPVSVWLYALPLVIWPHVYAATLFTGLVNLLALAGCWWIARRYWGPVAALAALLLFAVAPWAVVHSRRIWAQNLLPPIVVLWAIGALLAFMERRPRFVILHLLALSLAVLVHFAAVALAPASLLLFILFRRRLGWRYVWAGLFLALLPAVPFLIYLSGEGGVSVAGLAERAGAGAFWQPASWRYAWLLFSGAELHSLAGPEQFRNYLASIPPVAPISALLGLLLLVGLLWLARQAWQGRRLASTGREIALLLLVWLLAPPLVFLVFPAPVVLHYLLPIYPAPFIVAGMGFSRLLSLLASQRRVVRWSPLAWLLLVAVAGVQIWGTFRLHQLVAREATPGGLSTPLAMHLEAVEAAKAIWQREGGEVLVASAGENPEIDGTAAIYDALLAGVPHRFVDVQQSALFPASPTVVLLSAETGDAAPAARPYFEAATERTEVPLRRGEGTVRLLAVAGAPLPAVALDEPAVFANWVRLVGYDPLSNGNNGAARWRLYWHPGDNPDPADYHIFNHLLDAVGNRVAQADAAAYAPWQWRAGDTVISTFELELPDEVARPLTMRTGFYRYPSLENVPVLDVALNPVADAVTLPAE